MVMKMKEPLEEKHGQEPAEHPAHGAVQRLQIFIRIRQKMEQGDAQHQAGNKTDGNLQARMGKPNDDRQPTARQRRNENESAINRQQPTGRNHAPVIFNSAPSVEFRVAKKPERSSARALLPGKIFAAELAHSAGKFPEDLACERAV
jgi:hypothetical protein